MGNPAYATGRRIVTPAWRPSAPEPTPPQSFPSHSSRDYSQHHYSSPISPPRPSYFSHTRPTLSAFRHRTAVPEKDGRVHGPAGALAQSASLAASVPARGTVGEQNKQSQRFPRPRSLSLAAAVPAKATVGAWDQFPDGWVGGIGAGDIGAAWPGITGAAPS